MKKKIMKYYEKRKFLGRLAEYIWELFKDAKKNFSEKENNFTGLAFMGDEI